MIIPDIDVANPTTGVSNVVKQDPYGLSGASEVLGLEADLTIKKEQRDADAYEIKTRPDFQIGLLNAIEESKNEAETPDQMTELYLEKSKSIYDDLYQNAPNQFAKRKLEERFSQYQTAYGSQILQVQAQENQNLRILSVGQTIDKFTSQIGANGNYEANMAAIEQAIADAGAFTSPLEQEKLRLQANAQAKQVKLDYELGNNNFKEVTRLINDETFSEGLGVKEIQAYRDTIQKAKTTLEKKRFEDPAGYVMIQDPNATLDDVYNAQNTFGATRSIMPKDTAENVVAQVNTFQDSKQMKEFLNNIGQTYGKYKDNALRDLRKAGLSASYSYATGLDPVEDSQRIDYLFDTIKQSQGTDGKMISGSKIIEDNVKAKLNAKSETLEKAFNEPFDQAFAIKDQVYADMQISPMERQQQREQSRLLALSHYDKHGDINKAVTFATEHLFRGNVIENIGGKQLPVPTGVNAREIRNAAETLQKTLEINATNLEGMNVKTSGELLKNQSKWTTNEDNSGLILTDQNGVPLRTDAGMVEYTWKELEQVNKKPKVGVDAILDLGAQYDAQVEKMGKANAKQTGLPKLPDFKLKKKADGQSNIILKDMIDG